MLWPHRGLRGPAHELSSPKTRSLFAPTCFLSISQYRGGLAPVAVPSRHKFKRFFETLVSQRIHRKGAGLRAPRCVELAAATQKQLT